MLHINVTNKIAKYQVRDGDIVCDNTGYKVAFSFDSEWNDHADKTARFIWNGAYKDVDIVDGECEVPKIIDATEVFVGVYAGEMKTTTDARIPCVKSVLSRTNVGQPDQVKEYRDQAGIYADEAEASAADARAAASTAASEASSAAAASVAQKAEEMIAELGIVQEAGDSSTAVMSQIGAGSTFANALKGTAKGEVVRLTDVSPVPHKVKVKVRGKNLLDPNNLLKITSASATYSEPQLTIRRTNTNAVWSNVYIGIGEYEKFVGKTLAVSLEGLNEYKWNVLLVALDDANGLISEIIGQPVGLGKTTYKGTIPSVYGATKLALRFVSSDNSIATEENFVFQNLQLEEGTTATEYEPYIDPTSVTVTRSGKNLIKTYRYPSFNYQGITGVTNEDGSITLNGTATASTTYNIVDNSKNSFPLNKGRYVFSYGASLPTGCYFTIFGYVDGSRDGTFLSVNAPLSNGVLDIDHRIDAFDWYIHIPEGTVLNNITIYPQIEVGTELTQFEKPNYQTLTPNADGTVDGMTSASPVATIYSDTKGVTVEVEYNQDIESRSLSEKQEQEVVNIVNAHRETVAAKSANLFNPDEAIDGQYFKHWDGTFATLNGTSCAYVRLDGLGDYITKVNSSSFGFKNAVHMAIFDENKVYLGKATGTLTEGTETQKTDAELVIPINIEGAYYAGYNFATKHKNEVMFVKGAEYPTAYIPYEEYVYIPRLKVDLPTEAEKNPLYNKVLVCDGDSICAGDSVGSSSPKYKYGWCGRIGEANGMIWHNEGVGGGTITAETYSSNGTAKHWVCRNIDEIYAKYPNLDYLILEGGTNDADILTSDKIGTFKPTNFVGEAHDDTTFYGALDSLFYKALTYYPTAKIGFIIAHRMGRGNGNFGDTNNRRSYFLKAIEACKKWAIPYLDLWETSQLTPNLPCFYDPAMTADENRAAGKAYTDGQHLTDVGYDIITSKIEAWIKTL
jgi:lysophospholipase L1-like esterase